MWTLSLLMVLAGCGLIFKDNEDEDEDEDEETDADTDTDSDTDSDTPTDTGTDTDPAPCRGTNPRINTVILSNAGMVPGEEGDELGLRVTADAVDADGDLSVVELRVWIDTRVDGSVNSEYRPIEFPAQNLGDDCMVPRGSVAVDLAIGAFDLEFDTHYEVGAQVVDAHGGVSDVVIGDGYTPMANGQDGGP